mgnify:CR=1 FL=1
MTKKTFSTSIKTKDNKKMAKYVFYGQNLAFCSKIAIFAKKQV